MRNTAGAGEIHSTKSQLVVQVEIAAKLAAANKSGYNNRAPILENHVEPPDNAHNCNGPVHQAPASWESTWQKVYRLTGTQP